MPAGTAGIVSAKYQYQIAVFRAECRFYLLQYFLRVIFVNARLDIAACFDTRPNQTFRPYLRTFDKFRQLVDLLACVRAGSFCTNTGNQIRRVENFKTVAFQYAVQFDKTHSETGIGLVATVIFHGIGPCHAGERPGNLDAANLLEQMFRHALEYGQYVFLSDIRHFAVNLGKLRLAVGTQVLIAETFDDLEIPVEPADHQQLFQGLRRLRQSVKLSRIHTAWNDKITRTLGSRADEHRGFDFQEPEVVQIPAYLHRHFMT